MSSSHQYILNLIRNVRAEPCLWDNHSEYYRDHKYVAKSWVLVTRKVNRSLKTSKITASNVKGTWYNLLAAYDSCLLNGNSSTFPYFQEMGFLGDQKAWYQKPEKLYTDDGMNGGACFILKCQISVLIIGLYKFISKMYYQAPNGGTMVPQEIYLLTAIGCLIYVSIGALIKLCSAAKNFWSSKTVSFILLIVTVPVVSMIAETTMKSYLSTLMLPFGPLIYILLGISSMWLIIGSIAVNGLQRPFPPSKILAALDFATSMIWTNVTCFILRTIHADYVFYIIPVSVTANGFLSYIFCYYLWTNVNTIFPNFNENPFEMTSAANNPFLIEFKQKPRNQQLKNDNDLYEDKLYSF